MKVQDVEHQLEQEQKLQEILKSAGFLREGLKYVVRLHGRSRDKRRSSAFEKYWNPDKDSICIRFEPIPESRQTSVQPTVQHPRSASPYSSSTSPAQLEDLIRALNHAESRPGYKFVALKWFRDTALPSEGFSWASDDLARKQVLGDAINRKLILTSSVPNPNSAYPTTAIRLNRLMPEVRAILGNESGRLPDFAPVPIQGEPLSATVLRDRR